MAQQNHEHAEKKSEEKMTLSWLDEHHRVRNVLALIIVASYVLGLGVVGLVFPFVPDLQGMAIDYLKTMSSTFSGLVGMVVGYYFGKT